MTTLPSYTYAGARAMVDLHERHLRSFLDVWRRAKTENVRLPETTDPDYASMDALLVHVLRAARGYMTWMCEQLELADPRIDPAPDVALVDAEAARYVDHLVERWARPLANVAEARFEVPEYRSRWNVLYCIDAMLEHAVMHPIRHEYQLLRLLGKRT